MYFYGLNRSSVYCCTTGTSRYYGTSMHSTLLCTVAVHWGNQSSTLLWLHHPSSFGLDYNAPGQRLVCVWAGCPSILGIPCPLHPHAHCPRTWVSPEPPAPAPRSAGTTEITLSLHTHSAAQGVQGPPFSCTLPLAIGFPRTLQPQQVPPPCLMHTALPQALCIPCSRHASRTLHMGIGFPSTLHLLSPACLMHTAPGHWLRKQLPTLL